MSLSHSSTQRRSGRNQKKQSRRDKGRKGIVNNSRGSSLLEAMEYQNAVHVDSLEGISGNVNEEDDQEEYDEVTTSPACESLDLATTQNYFQKNSWICHGCQYCRSRSCISNVKS